MVTSRRLHKGEFLCYQGDIWPYLVYVTSGKLEWTMLSAEGKEIRLFTLDSGNFFWAHSFFDDDPMPASLIVSKEAQVYLLKRDYLLPILYRNPDALFEVTRVLTRIMRRAREIIYRLAFQPLAGRLANYIISSLDDTENPLLERDMTLKDVATVCATSPEVVCRLLHQFQVDGIIKISRTHIIINDRDSLMKLAKIE
ncbi:MAG TPA: Crp/Fnr family transcriptional regulator [Anaerolineae bacterium]|nr:Crp/Fnr family transcriptional regulator [Anaerolineae bacterium]